MNILKSTLESFKENELLTTHKLKIKGGLPVDGLPPELVLEDEFEDPIIVNDAGPRGGGGSSSATSGASLGNPIAGNLPPTGGR